MDNVVFVTSNYPSQSRPHCGVFVHQLVRAISSLGVRCSVINPVSVFDRRYGKLDPKVSIEVESDKIKVQVLRPKYVSFSSVDLLSFNTDHLTQKSFMSSVYRALPLLDIPPDIMYGHFLYPGGASAVNIATHLSVPSVVAVGESSFWSVKPLGFEKAIKDFQSVSGIVSVSSMIKKSLVDKLLIRDEKIKTFPNGVDLSLFYPRNRREMRDKHSLPQDKFIVSFIGHFDERKGPHRLLSAVSDIDNIGLIFMGNGSTMLENRNILFKGTIEHSLIPELLSASDIFVLPTLEEGSCNSIIEAMACGLPVVTSNGKFNDDIVDDQTAIRVDPENLSEIRNAVIRLQHDSDLCRRMSCCGIERAGELDINIRAMKIVAWMEKILEQRGSGRRNNERGKNMYAEHRA